MKIAVAIKQVPDTASRIVLTPDGTGIDASQFKYILNPYDEFAIGEAVAQREKLSGSELVALTVGPSRVTKMVRDVLAVGADRAIHLLDPTGSLDVRLSAEVAAAVVAKEGIRVVFTGRQAIDDDSAAFPQMLAEFLGWPHAVPVSKVIALTDDRIEVERDGEDGVKETLELKLPAVIGATKGVAKMKLASLPAIRAAATKPIQEISVSELGISLSQPVIQYRGYELPPERGTCRMISGAPVEQARELVRRLREEAKVI